MCLQYIHTMSCNAASVLTMCCIQVAITWTLKRKSMLCMTSSILMTMRTGLTSCVKATILEREKCYALSLVHSKCLIEA
jgi:hypothetical protein